MRKRKNLIFWRVINNKTQVEISKKLGISNGYYSNLEKGRVNPSFNLLVKFRDIFDVDDVLELFRLSQESDIYGDCDKTGDIQ